MKPVKTSLKRMLWILSSKEESKAVFLNFRETGKKTDSIQNQRLFLSLSYDFYIYPIHALTCLLRGITGSIFNWKKLEQSPITKRWKQPTCLSMDELINKMWYIDARDSLKKEGDSNTHYNVDDLEDIMLSEKN